MIDATRLLRDLQGELGPLVSDLGVKVKADEEVRARLDREWRTAFDAHRTGRSFEDWLEDRLTQVAVAWLLACVFVRFCEDNLLIDEATIAGPGDRGDAARAAQQRYFTEHPHDSDREYLHSVFRAAAALPSLGGLLADGESPLWLVDPPADACTRLLTRFRATDDAGNLVHDFTDPTWSTRFLGDLYQDLSQYAKDTYALLQTPDFVEEFILDRTLTPAIETFGLAGTTLIDPTCGSGHFLLGAFGRLFNAWQNAEPGVDSRELAQRALSQVTGVDLNPFASAIARFRLLVAALQASGITRLADSPNFAIDVAVGDSLLWGTRPGQLMGMEAAATAADRQFLYRTEHADLLRRIFDTQYAAVVGNPPYIIARDKALNAQYRRRYPHACRGKYSLAVPFLQRFFELAFTGDGSGQLAGFTGMITANSFMKRQFGKGLVERLIPTWDVTHVIDISGAYVPGHGTPTVIMFGRHQGPSKPTIRTVMGIRGEPSTPSDPAKGRVWTAVTAQVDASGSEGEFVSVADTDRLRFASHPWSIGGGGAAELKERLDDIGEFKLDGIVLSAGFGAITGGDDAFAADSTRHLERMGVHPEFHVPYTLGDSVRDWSIESPSAVIFPYEREVGAALEELPDGLAKLFWLTRTDLKARVYFGETNEQRGLKWWEFSIFFPERFFRPPSVAFAFVATHNHFVLDRGGKVFKQSAPIIKLSQGSTLDDHLSLVAILNSAVACFWMKQVFHNKGASTDQRGARVSGADAWDNSYEHDSTKLRRFPLPIEWRSVRFGKILDSLASDLLLHQPAAVCGGAAPTRVRLDTGRMEAGRISADMVAAQEELDWAALQLYGLTGESLTVPDGEIAPPLQTGERAFEIVFARKVAAGEIETAWFSRHRSMPITEPPAHWPGGCPESRGTSVAAPLVRRLRPHHRI